MDCCNSKLKNADKEAEPYYDNCYNMGRSNARLVGQKWFCGLCHKVIEVAREECCENCGAKLVNKETALEKAKKRFGEYAG